MKKCELCKLPATLYCESDQASLCTRCDLKVHEANFLVARHSRTLLCKTCQAPTPWEACGARLGNAVTECERCVEGERRESEGEVDDEESLIDVESGGSGEECDDDEMSESEDEGQDDDDEEEEECENQVVPWSSSTPPPAASSSSSNESWSSSSSVGGIRKRMRENDTDSESQDNHSASSSVKSLGCLNSSFQRRSPCSCRKQGETTKP